MLFNGFVVKNIKVQFKVFRYIYAICEGYEISIFI